MNRHARLLVAIAFIVLEVLLVGAAMAQEPISPQSQLGTVFTYQGQLKKNNAPVTDNCLMAFRLYDQTGGGSQIGSPITATVPITNGLFTVALDFGSAPFAGEARWLGITVRCTADSAYIDLSRQALTAAPYALYSTSTGALQGRSVSNASPATNQVLKWNGSAWVPANDETSGGPGNSWSLTGNADTNSLVNFLGTTDNLSLTLRVNNAPALRLLPNPISPNLIGGYGGNTVVSGAVGAVIAGGGDNANLNWVLTNFGVVSGGAGNVLNGDYAAIGGGYHNTAMGLVATVGGGIVNTAGPQATVGGGVGNVAGGSAAMIGGGYGNLASGITSTIGGGEYISVTGQAATVSGGSRNTVPGDYATVGGGANNVASGYASVIGGGGGIYFGQSFTNTASGDWSVVGGGNANTASGGEATVAGGFGNVASGSDATVGGGWENMASGYVATVAGGHANWAGGGEATVAGGFGNIASHGEATVSGGFLNTASGWGATVPGGSYNTAGGQSSFAAGHQARTGAGAVGSFVWSDSNNFDTWSWNPNEFVARATGGFWFVTGIDGSGNTASGMRLPGGSSAWSPLSDRNAKTNYSSVDGREVLARLVAIPIQTWNYKAQDPAIRHIGPVAQDFYSAFSVGEDDKFISTVDADGVALASIQGLYQIVQEKDAQIASLQQQNTDMEARLSALEARVDGDALNDAPMSNNWATIAIASIGLVMGVLITRRRHS